MSEQVENVDINNPEHVAGDLGFPTERTFVTDATSALGLDSSLKDILKYEQEKVAGFNPPEQINLNLGQETAAEPEPEATETPEPEPETEPVTEPEATETPEPEPKPEPESPEPKAELEPQKYNLHGREYTEEELSALVEKALAPAPETKPVEKAEPEKTPEQAQEELRNQEIEYLKQTGDRIATDDLLSDEDVEDILVGGAKAVETFKRFAKDTAARAVLEARKSIYNELNPVLADLTSKVTPVIQQTAELEKYTTSQMFNQRHPEFQQAGQMELAVHMAEEMTKQFPEHVSKMSREQFVDEVARQADSVVAHEFKRWYPNSESNWKDHIKVSNQPEPEAPVAEPEAPVAEKAKPAPRPKPPATSSPRISGGQPENWHKKTANSLV